jgi:hypothetical protein
MSDEDQKPPTNHHPPSSPGASDGRTPLPETDLTDISHAPVATPPTLKDILDEPASDSLAPPKGADAEGFYIDHIDEAALAARPAASANTAAGAADSPLSCEGVLSGATDEYVAAPDIEKRQARLLELGNPEKSERTKQADIDAHHSQLRHREQVVRTLTELLREPESGRVAILKALQRIFGAAVPHPTQGGTQTIKVWFGSKIVPLKKDRARGRFIDRERALQEETREGGQLQLVIQCLREELLSTEMLEAMLLQMMELLESTPPLRDRKLEKALRATLNEISPLPTNHKAWLMEMERRAQESVTSRRLPPAGGTKGYGRAAKVAGVATGLVATSALVSYLATRAKPPNTTGPNEPAPGQNSPAPELPQTPGVKALAPERQPPAKDLLAFLNSFERYRSIEMVGESGKRTINIFLLLNEFLMAKNSNLQGKKLHDEDIDETSDMSLEALVKEMEGNMREFPPPPWGKEKYDMTDIQVKKMHLEDASTVYFLEKIMRTIAEAIEQGPAKDKDRIYGVEITQYRRIARDYPQFETRLPMELGELYATMGRTRTQYVTRLYNNGFPSWQKVLADGMAEKKQQQEKVKPQEKNNKGRQPQR